MTTTWSDLGRRAILARMAQERGDAMRAKGRPIDAGARVVLPATAGGPMLDADGLPRRLPKNRLEQESLATARHKALEAAGKVRVSNGRGGYKVAAYKTTAPFSPAPPLPPGVRRITELDLQERAILNRPLERAIAAAAGEMLELIARGKL